MNSKRLRFTSLGMGLDTYIKDVTLVDLPKDSSILPLPEIPKPFLLNMFA